MRMYDDLIIDAPFWPDALLEIDQTPFPKAAVSALAGFGNLGDEIQMIEGFGAADETTCGQVSTVAGAIAALGAAACNLITDTRARAQCVGLVSTGGGASAAIIQSSMGCGSSGTSTRETDTERQARLDAERRLVELEYQARADREKRQQTESMLLIGGGVALAAAIAYVALRR